ncbi:MAG: YbaK/EbsC family protein [Candidatus Pacearchaeota archaeon]|jgi:prolyl-tRNA editing enzyme YbaK/EbsC (Cys-tRNA(Pro) deacylase)
MTELESVKILKGKNIPYRLIKLSDKGISFEDVIRNAEDKINPDEICKTIVVKDKKENKYAFLLKGNQKIDFSKVKEVIGKKASIVSFEDLKKSIGKEPGAICPFLLDMPIYIDKKVFETEKINFGSGDHLYGLEIFSKDLNKIIQFQKVEVSK